MKSLALPCVLLFSLTAFAADRDGFIPLFNGKDLNDWKASEKPGTFSVQDGILMVHGNRSHLFYTGPVQNHDFKNFHLRAEVMTSPGANSGIFFHTEWHDTGWPAKGIEIQVNNTQIDPKKTGGIYNIKDTFVAPAKDNEWFILEIIVEGKHVVTKVNGKMIADYTEPENVPPPPKGRSAGLISRGTFAVQGHDPGSRVLYRKIEVKPLP